MRPANGRLAAIPARTAAEAIAAAVGPWEEHCSGYEGPAAYGYVCAAGVATGVVRRSHSPGIDRIMAFHLAEKKLRFGHLNATPVSSFCSPCGHVVGHGLLRPAGRATPQDVRTRHDGEQIPVWPLRMLQEPAAMLLDTFPVLPGSMTPCAMPWPPVTMEGPGTIGAILAVGIAEDRDSCADMFMEDTITIPRSEPDPIPEPWHAFRSQENGAVASILEIGEMDGVLYREIYAGYVIEWVPRGSVGCAIPGAAYITLARRAVPSPASDLLGMPLGQWAERFARVP